VPFDNFLERMEIEVSRSGVVNVLRVDVSQSVLCVHFDIIVKAVSRIVQVLEDLVDVEVFADVLPQQSDSPQSLIEVVVVNKGAEEGQEKGEEDVELVVVVDLGNVLGFFLVLLSLALALVLLFFESQFVEAVKLSSDEIFHSVLVEGADEAADAEYEEANNAAYNAKEFMYLWRANSINIDHIVIRKSQVVIRTFSKSF
jgi:hypothetical protein